MDCIPSLNITNQSASVYDVERISLFKFGAMQEIKKGK